MNRGLVWLEAAPALRRCGVKGARAAALLAEIGINVPKAPNSWAALRPADRDDSDHVIARLGATEFFIEEGTDGAATAALDARCAAGMPGAYPVLREDVALRLGGGAAPAVLAEVCNVDFAPVPTGKPIVMTLMIGVSVLVLPQQRDEDRIFRIWCDPTFGSYLRHELDAVVTRIQSGRAQ